MQKKGWTCQPVQRKSPFRQGSTAGLDASFSGNQAWVSSEPKRWKSLLSQQQTSDGLEEPTRHLVQVAYVENYGVLSSPAETSGGAWIQTGSSSSSSPRSQSTTQVGQSEVDKGHLLATQGDTTLQRLSSGHLQESTGSSDARSALAGQVRQGARGSAFVSSPSSELRRRHGEESPSYFAHQAFLQEACLLRYFIEEISPWFDHCDHLRHFRLEVPRRARHCSTVRNAIFAVSARHLVRLPRYKTPRGIVYQGQLLPDMEDATAVEYTLRCIPDLVKFPDVSDPINQENIMVAAVILRQYEEMEEDMDDDGPAETAAQSRVNFLAITQTIIESMMSHRLEQSLATAAYWIAIRQEVYYALTRQRAPIMQFQPQDWRRASVANKFIMLASEVTKWFWEDRSIDKWERLVRCERQLVDACRSELVPILEKRAEKLQGQIFPTIWYSSEDQVTASQHLELSRMILTAESPHLENANRAAHRRTESQVRSMVLKICGIALNHINCKPALVNGVIAVTLYGEYFTEAEERDALVAEIIHRAQELNAWPMQKRHERLKQRWRSMDG
ncbi:hypothetical protein ASPACDRAFT_47461 [Aspergillus aculeatus ATCC 16872]|uniref:ARCA-like protein n=1 Tax=Aspergillus aculeatus (strain ATCC 16872 / CBS 172.66 / WB 5094) TaxID=690307 RepID=A0A1L9WHE9_ASPA1|nr:uncharacterized protein ASPACDRAFT_47461 [Aspergillus aculeatus ATCC 16872]OJJ95573.1 hypothetical protein ASPACDRAFT_47461 [Aspergillus aculeatus ATCC 16872]